MSTRHAIACALLAAALAAGAAHAQTGGDRKVLILPFQGLNAADNQRWITGAIMQTLATDLGRTRGVAAISYSAPAGAPDTVTALKTGRLSNANLVVFGAYQIVDNQVRVTAQIADVGQGTIVGSSQATGPLAELLSVEDRLAEQVRQAVTAQPAALAAGGGGGGGAAGLPTLFGDSVPNLPPQAVFQPVYQVYDTGRKPTPMGTEPPQLGLYAAMANSVTAPYLPPNLGYPVGYPVGYPYGGYGSYPGINYPVYGGGFYSPAYYTPSYSYLGFPAFSSFVYYGNSCGVNFRYGNYLHHGGYRPGGSGCTIGLRVGGPVGGAHIGRPPGGGMVPHAPSGITPRAGVMPVAARGGMSRR